MSKEYIKSQGLGVVVELDASEIYPNDPGMGTPVLVVDKLTNGTASWNCAINECETDEGPLSREAMDWLNQVTPQVEAWMAKHGV